MKYFASGLMVTTGALVGAFLFSSCAVSKKTNKSNSPPSWAESMQGMQETIKELLPLVVDVKNLNNSGNRDKIASDVKKLINSAGLIEKHPSMPGRDLTARFISQAFVEDIKKVDEAIQAEKWDYARYSLLNVTSYCIECHTRTSSGPSFGSTKFDAALADVGHFERGEYYLSVRRYSDALSAFEKFISTALEKGENFLKIDKALRYSLAITVKFMENPDESARVLSWINHPKAPYYLKANALAWSKSISDWRKESDKSYRGSVASLLLHIRGLVKKANQAGSGLEEAAGEVYWMRALSELHRVLATQLTEPQRGETLYLTGLAYEEIRDLSIWNMHESYYESCIRNAPHSSWARRCYLRLEESIFIGYSGSSGSYIPIETQQRLMELKKLTEANVQR